MASNLPHPGLNPTPTNGDPGSHPGSICSVDPQNGSSKPVTSPLKPPTPPKPTAPVTPTIIPLLPSSLKTCLSKPKNVLKERFILKNTSAGATGGPKTHSFQVIFHYKNYFKKYFGYW